MPIKITSKRDGFWRAGVRHSAEPTVYPDDRFTKKELKALEDEPMLIVEKLKAEPEKKGGKGGGDKKKKGKEDESPEAGKDENGPENDGKDKGGGEKGS